VEAVEEGIQPNVGCVQLRQDTTLHAAQISVHPRHRVRRLGAVEEGNVVVARGGRPLLEPSHLEHLCAGRHHRCSALGEGAIEEWEVKG
jgi:hypothetical protein